MAGAYPSYRQPRLRWLPHIPEHWQENRAKTVLNRAGRIAIGIALDRNYST